MAQLTQRQKQIRKRETETRRLLIAYRRALARDDPDIADEMIIRLIELWDV